MRKEFEPYIKLAPFFGIGLVIVAIAVAWIVYNQRGAIVTVKGSVLKVRTLPLDENSSLAVIDFRFVNPSDYLFIVRKVDVSAGDPNGQVLDGSVASEVDARRLFEYYPVLGQRYNESLIMRTKVKPKQSMDRMIAVRFEVPEKILEQRKFLRIRIEELDGPVAMIEEGKK